MTYFHGNLFISTHTANLPVQDINGCNINSSYYQNTTIYIQYLPSRLFLCLGLHFENKFSKPGFKQKIEKLNTNVYLRKVLLGFDGVIKKIIPKASFWVDIISDEW